jgi:hypothetical protein
MPAAGYARIVMLAGPSLLVVSCATTLRELREHEPKVRR